MAVGDAARYASKALRASPCPCSRAFHRAATSNSTTGTPPPLKCPSAIASASTAAPWFSPAASSSERSHGRTQGRVASAAPPAPLS